MLQQSNAWLLSALLIGSLSLSLPTKSLAQVIKFGPPSCPGIAPTFDLCPVRKRPGYDQALVDYLIQHQIPSTFFMSSKWMAKHEEEVDHLLGIKFFEVGTHGKVHAYLPRYNTDEQRTEILSPVKVLHEHYAHEATLFRPLYREYNDVTVDVVKAIGLRFIQWNIESGIRDPSLSTKQILTRVAIRAKPGSSIVFQANWKGKQNRQVIERHPIEVLPHKGLDL